MPQYKNIIYGCEEGIGIVTINRPKALNALNAETVSELDDVFTKIGREENIKVVIVTGAGEKSFVAGADIKEMSCLDAAAGRRWGQDGQAVFTKLENLPQPVIAAVNGYALGGGCELAMACDIRIASVKAKFGQPETGLGITPGFGGTQRLSRLVGKGRAKELLFTADMIDATEAYRIGLVNKVTEPEDLLAEAEKMARRIIKNAPLAVQLTKAAVNNGSQTDLHRGIAYEAEVFGLCFATQDQKEGMAAFMEKRKPSFQAK